MSKHKKQHKLKVELVVSGYVHELIKKLHENYPNKERSGIARIEKKQGYYLMSDIKFPKQSNHGSETEIKDGGLDELLTEVFTNNPEQLGERKCWIHSHHTMGCFRSGTDEAAKRSFNDGNMDYRWSVVTAYDATSVNYKCALNVFKPVNMEFDIPVRNEEFDVKTYMQMYGQDYTQYERAMEKLAKERTEGLTQASIPYEPTAEDIATMITIFNIATTEDNTAVIKSLLIKDSIKAIESRKEDVEEIYEEAVDGVNEAYQLDYFSEKLTELEDSIIKQIYSNTWNGVNLHGKSSQPLFPQGDPTKDEDSYDSPDYYQTKYNNNTGSLHSNFPYGDY